VDINGVGFPASSLDNNQKHLGTELLIGSMQNKRVLITGGAGFIGSNLDNSLSPYNEVLVVDNGYLGTQENLHSSVSFMSEVLLKMVYLLT
jgi:FlaA1/EpsC-like NDP-sugar epimerase